MKDKYEHIEEKLIPYLEGVLNVRERREVEEAINSDKELAKEVGELRGLILVLRQGFANGLKPPQDELGVSEVVTLASFGAAETIIPGSSQEKARLFCSDEALDEYRLLRALQEDLERTTLDRENVPELPEALRKEFNSLGTSSSSSRPRLLEQKKKTLVLVWKRASALLDRLNPKPLMATAAAVVVFTLGVHFYQRPAADAPNSFKEMASSTRGATLSSDSIAPTDERASMGASSEASGIAVFTSDDRALLKEQAEKLLAKKIRYTVTTDRILVAEADLEGARKVLWDDAQERAVAMVDKEKSSEKAIAMNRTGSIDSAVRSSQPESAGAVMYTAKGEVVPAPNDAKLSASHNRSLEGREEVKFYPPSGKSAAGPAIEVDGMTQSKSSREPRRRQGDADVIGSNDSKRYEPEYSAAPAASVAASSVKSAKPAFKRSTVERPAAAGSRPDAPVPHQIKREAGQLAHSEDSSTSAEARRAKLRALALGKDKDMATAASAPVPQEVFSESSHALQQSDDGGVAAAGDEQLSAPLPLEAMSNGASDVDAQEDLEQRLTRLQKKRQEIGTHYGIELSVEAKDGKVYMYVRPIKALTKSELEVLRKKLRKDLKLAESDVIVFR